MKILISIILLNITTITFAQTKPLVDTLIKFNENTYLVQKGNSLFGKPSVKYFFRFSEALNYPKKIMILEHAITKKRGVVNFEDSSVIVPFEYNYIRKTKDTNVVMLKNKIGIGLYFFIEKKQFQPCIIKYTNSKILKTTYYLGTTVYYVPTITHINY